MKVLGLDIGTTTVSAVVVEDGNLDNYTYFLRRSLRKVGSSVHLSTVRGVGYRLEEKHV